MAERSDPPAALPLPPKLKGLGPPPRGSPAAPPPGPGDVLDGRYRLVELIAEGGMGSVYRGERVGLARGVAIKFLRTSLAAEPHFVARFNVEAHAMSRLTHPNCVSVVDFGVDRVPYLVMELVDGVSLRAILKEGALPLGRALSIARQMLAGLAHAHASDTVHRDVKPENILITQTVGFEDHVRILDFGLAKLMDSDAQLTAGMALGTPNYLAPEQMKEGAVDARMDVYGVGLVLYEMLTGCKTFDAPTTAEVLLKQQRQLPPPFREAAPNIALPAALEVVVRRALEKAPADRFPTALAMREALDASAAAPSERTVFEPSPWGAQGPPVRRARRTTANRLAVWGQRARHALVKAGGFVFERRRDRRVLAAVAAGLVLVLALALRRSPAPPAARPPTAAARTKVSPPPAPAPAPRLGEVDALVAQGRSDEALARVRALRAADPTDAEAAAALARLCFQRHRYGEGAGAYRAAMKNDPRWRSDAALIRLVIDSLESDRFSTQAQDLLRDLGAPAKPLVAEAARAHRNPTVRDRARDLLRYWDHKPWFRR